MVDRPTFTALGVRVNAEPFAAVLDRVLNAPERGDRLTMHFATAHSLVEAHDSEALRLAFEVGVVEPDGMPVVWLGRRAGVRVERVCGPDFMPAVMEAGVALDRSHYFFGGAPGVADALADNMIRRFPGLRVVGTESPPFRALSAIEDDEVVKRINAADPDYVWIGLGAPKQDLWAFEHRPRLRAAVLLAVGAAFDFHAGTRRRAPAWMQRTGTEWIYRLVNEPRRLAGRYTRTNARFLELAIRDRSKKAD